MYRRPLPATNLKFLSTLMWDGRESSTQTGTQKITYATNPGDLLADLAHQAIDATTGHAQASVPPSAAQVQDIVNFETSLRTAQEAGRPLSLASVCGSRATFIRRATGDTSCGNLSYLRLPTPYLSNSIQRAAVSRDTMSPSGG